MAQQLNALIITGHDHFHHRWRAASEAFRDMLETSGRFTVKVTEEFRGATAATLDPYDVVLLSYYGADKPGDPEIRFGTHAEEALFDFVRSGKGLVACHTSFRGGLWGDEHGDEFEKLLGGVARAASRRVGNVEGFSVTVVDADDDVMEGFPATFVQVLDDKMVNLVWHPEASPHALATIYDDPGEYLGGAYYAIDGLPGPKLYEPSEVAKLEGVGEDHPVVWKNHYGRGRVFALSLGHVGATTLEDAWATRDTGVYVGPTGCDAIRTPEFATLLTRGSEWAATGTVTLPFGAGHVAAPTRIG